MKSHLHLLKKIGNGAIKGLVSPLVVSMRAEQTVFGADKAENVFQSYSQIVSLVPGLQGEYVRRSFYEMVLPRCGSDFTVGFGTIFSKQRVEVGKRVYVGMRCTIGNVILEDNVTIGSNIDILSGSSQHNFDDPDMPIQDQGGTYTTVCIGENSWIGNGSIIMANVGAGCIIGAGSLVNKPVPDRVIAVGNPVRVLRER